MAEKIAGFENPAGVQPITLGSLDHLGVDGAHRLYWRGVPVVTRTRVRLDWWQAALAIFASAAAVSMAVLDALRFFGLGAD